jgi:hypothetical protein
MNTVTPINNELDPASLPIFSEEKPSASALLAGHKINKMEMGDLLPSPRSISSPPILPSLPIPIPVPDSHYSSSPDSMEASKSPRTAEYLSTFSRKRLRQMQQYYEEDISRENSPDQPAKQGLTPDYSHCHSTLETFADFVSQLNKFLNQEIKIEVLADLIHTIAENDLLGARLCFEAIDKQIQHDPHDLCVSLLKDLLTETFKRLQSHHVLMHREILTKIARVNPELYILIHSNITDAYAEELINYYLHYDAHEQNNEAIICHPWFIPTHHFIKALCQKSITDPSQAHTLLNAVEELISHPHFYPIQASSVSDVVEYLQALPSTAEFKEARNVSFTWGHAAQSGIPPPLQRNRTGCP